MSQEPNHFVRTLIVVFVTALIVMVFMSFVWGEPRYQITSGTVTVIGFVVVLVLSESFNNLSLGKVISLNREVKNKEAEKNQVKAENEGLRQELVELIANFKQSQASNKTEFSADTRQKNLRVIKAQESDRDLTQGQEKAQPTGSTAGQGQAGEESHAEMKRLQAAERIGLQKYMDRLSVPDAEMIEGARFGQEFEAVDPIMKGRAVFAGYIRMESQEEFLEVRHRSLVSSAYYDHLYVMLNKVRLYHKKKGVPAELVLIVPEIEDEEDNDQPLLSKRLFDQFQAAIANKLLRVEYVSVSRDDIREFEDRESGRA